jgi:hypothetical protein
VQHKEVNALAMLRSIFCCTRTQHIKIVMVFGWLGVELFIS